MPPSMLVGIASMLRLAGVNGKGKGQRCFGGARGWAISLRPREVEHPNELPISQTGAAPPVETFLGLETGF